MRYISDRLKHTSITLVIDIDDINTMLVELCLVKKKSRLDTLKTDESQI